MINIDLIKNLLIIAIAGGIVTTLTVQKIKEQVTKKKYLFYIALAVSMIIGTLFAKVFSDVNWMYAVWCGFFTWIDADILYKTFEEKIFTRFTDLNKVIEIDRTEGD